MQYTDSYNNEIEAFIKDNDLSAFNGCKLLFSGGTGLICSYFIDALLATDYSFKLTLLCTNEKRAKERFCLHKDDSRIEYKEANLLEPLAVSTDYDFILSAASFTDPKNYAAYPVETITTNVLGTHNLLEAARAQKNLKKFLVFSSCEVYGEETSVLTEETKGIVDCLNVRSCYNESKRLIETMAISYGKEYDVNAVIGRFSRVYGPTMKLTDSKALSQFLLNAINKKDIVLKSQGTQKFSYCYVSDAAASIISLLLRGDNNNAYNITNDLEIFELKKIAQIIANKAGVDVKFELPINGEQMGYSAATIAIQDASKIKKLGWSPKVGLNKGIESTLDIVSQRIEKERKI